MHIVYAGDDVEKDNKMRQLAYYQVRILLLRRHHSNSFRIYRLALS